MLRVIKARHSWPEKAGFAISRPSGGATDYIFLLFHNPVKIEICGEVILTKPGALIVYDKKTPEYFSADCDMTHDWIHLQGELPKLMDECGLSLDKIYYPPSLSHVTETVRLIENECLSEKRMSAEMCDSLLRTMFYRLSRAILDGEKEFVGESETVERFKDFRSEMFASLERRRSVADMAAEVNLSESRFYALYKEIFGISPTKDLISARVERAKFYLGSGKYSVSEVAFLVGYANVFHFIRQFKAETGVTPGDFMR